MPSDASCRRHAYGVMRGLRPLGVAQAVVARAMMLVCARAAFAASARMARRRSRS
jgi:hypothetical protein